MLEEVRVDFEDLFSNCSYDMSSNKDNDLNKIRKIIGENLSSDKKIKYSYLNDETDSYIYFPKKDNKNDKKKILLVSHELSRTGAPIVVLDTAKVLVKNGYYVIVVSLKDGPLYTDFIDVGVPVVIMNKLRYVQYFKSEVLQFFDKIDLDYFVNNVDYTFMVTATLYNYVRRYFNTKNKIYWWIHEGSESYNILDPLMPKAIAKNVRVLCGGQYAANQLINRGYHYYPKVLNYGVFDENIVKEKRKKNDKVTFLLAGTIGKRKGQLIFLDAIKKLRDDERKQAKFIFIGDPYDGDIDGNNIKKEIKEFSDENDCVSLYSSIPREELYELYKNIDVLVLASIDDPMPVVATENFMLENICICSNQTGTSFYIVDGENGFVFQSNDSNHLSSKLSYIIGSKDRLDEIKKNGRKIYDRYFNIDRFEKNLLNLIQGDNL